MMIISGRRADGASRRRGAFNSTSLTAALAAIALTAAAQRAPAAESIELTLPIDCEIGRTCAIQYYVDHDPSPGASDFACGTLTYDGHNGTDFRLQSLAEMHSGVSVLAAAAGRVLRLRDELADIPQSAPSAPHITGRECGNGIVLKHGSEWQTQYCHMAQGGFQVKPGDLVSAGQPLGRVGLSGETSFPHLHFTVRHRGNVVDPFAFDAPAGSCHGGLSLWGHPIREALDYRERTILNFGFATDAVSEAQIETGEVARGLDAHAKALVAFVRVIGLRRGDVAEVTLQAPDGSAIASHRDGPLDHSKAQYFLFAGKKRSSERWASGLYRAGVNVSHGGQIVLVKYFEISI